MENNSSKSRLKSFLFICVIISPILSLYSRNGVSLSILLIVVSYLLYILFANRKFHIYNCFGTILTIFLFLVGVFFAVIRSTNINSLFRAFQFVVLIFVPLSISGRESDYTTVKKIYIRIALFASLFLIAQFLILNIFNIYIPGIIDNPVFPPNESILSITSKTISSGRRASGFFSEPASHSVYALGAFVLALFDKKSAKQKLVLFFLALGILMSVSSTGILGLAFSVLLYIFYEIASKNRKIHLSSILAFFFLAMAFFVLTQTSIWALFIQRMDQGTSLNNRFAAYSQPFNYGVGEVLLGHGMDLEALPSSVYYAGYPRFIYFFGFVGLLLWLVTIISLFRGAKSEIAFLLLVFLFLNIGEATMLGFSGTLFLLLACLGRKKAIDYSSNFRYEVKFVNEKRE